MRRNALQSFASIVVAVVAAAVAFVSPIASLLLYIVVPAAFLVGSARTSEAPTDLPEADSRP